MTNPATSKHAPHALPLPPAWAEAIDAYIAARRRAGQPQTSLEAYTTALQHLGRRAPAGPWELTPAQLAAYADAQTWTPGTKRIRRQTILNFYRWAIRTGHVDASPLTEDSMPVVKAQKPRPRPAPDAVYHAALAAAKPREAMMLRLAAELGIRRAEVACVHTDDVLEDYEGGYSLLIHGKGEKDRVLPMPESLALAVRAYPRGYLFPGDYGGHLSPRWVGRRIGELMPGIWKMHTLRHRFGTRLYAATGDLLLAQEALGHASPDTTRRYVDFDRSKMRGVVENLATGRRVTPDPGRSDDRLAS